MKDSFKIHEEPIHSVKKYFEVTNYVFHLFHHSNPTVIGVIANLRDEIIVEEVLIDYTFRT